MKKKKFDKLSKYLLEKCNYKKYDQHWQHEDYAIAKGFHRNDNEWEEDRCAYQIVLNIYDYSDKNYPQLTPEQRDYVGIEIHIMVSRTSSERVDMVMSWHDGDNIEDIESVAEKFYQWVCTRWPEPREYD